MPYDKKQLEMLNSKYSEIDSVYNRLFLKLIQFNKNLSNTKASEYLMHGVCRRLKTINRCIHNIFNISAPDRVEKLPNNELIDININLHAYFVNIAGIFDNLAWVFVHENDLLGRPKNRKINKHGVGLFSVNTQNHLKVELKDYLTSDRINSWYSDYSKNYRDALAHRIPLYVPPATLNDSESERYNSLEDELQKLNILNPAELTKYDELQKKQMQLGNTSILFNH